ncbi:ROK family protein [Microcella daejeonensis]|uniref:ROK family protein n=1 Tax=Microcella daejeonensis TaxID=2994971 RepID=UPI002271BE6B|nr:ROK family protein [Microcella daejeonensis]WAB84996.1 ROK family protein [Microcella daejeonensis]
MGRVIGAKEPHVSTALRADHGRARIVPERTFLRRDVGTRPMIVGIETGGTKVVVAISDTVAPDSPVRIERIPTTIPVETFGRVRAIIAETLGGDRPEAVGIASFGPLNVDPDQGRYGWITGTTKPDWAFTDVGAHLSLDVDVPRAFVTDVTGAAIGESTWGAARDLRRVAYATVGTGIGVGLIDGDRLIAGNGYPEMGNVIVRRHALDDFAGVCPYHGDCVEGLASGPAIIARWGASASELPAADLAAVHDIVGYYIAQLLSTVTYTVGTERIVLGGGVLRTPGLLDAVRWHFDEIIGGPMAGHGLEETAADYIVPPALGDRSGVLGALALASRLLPTTSWQSQPTVHVSGTSTAHVL